jgi:hypothetical protein
MATRNAFLRHALEQGVWGRQVTADSLFPDELQQTFKI